MTWQSFKALSHPQLIHGFSRRLHQNTPPSSPSKASSYASTPTCEVPRDQIDHAISTHWKTLGILPTQVVQATQPHGNQVALVQKTTREPIPDVDALITKQPEIALSIRVADCAAIFFFDPVQHAIGLAHSGKKGTEGHIAQHTIKKMTSSFQTRPEDLIVQLSPCIRPPLFEIDFAADIARQVQAMGVRSYHDCGICTGKQVAQYYSYRVEKGKTGRMWAVLMLKKKYPPLDSV